MKEKAKEKPFLIRLSKEMWIFLKKQAVDQETSMNVIVNLLLEKYKKKIEKSID